MAESVSLKEHFEAILAQIEQRNQERFQAQADAINKAESAMTKRLETLNELRGDVATKSQIQSVEQRVQDMGDRLNRTEGRSGGISSTLLMAIAIGTLLAAAIGLYIRAH